MGEVLITARIVILLVQLALVLIYGAFGTILTALLFLRLGPTRFFKRNQRPTPPSVATDPIYGEHRMLKLKSSDVVLHYVSKGSNDQPLMLFVHGFPECWYAWRFQMKYFSKNYRVVAIDQRGYGLSSKPANVADYKRELLARDVADVIEQLGYKSCVLVGHDWGAVVAWTVAQLYPQLLDKLIILNVPHPTSFRVNMSFTQVRRSWYMFFYQIPLIPELLINAGDLVIFKRAFCEKPMGLTNTSNMTADDIEVFKYTFSQEGAATAAVNYYRAAMRHPNYSLPNQITVPVLMVWGCQDMALGEELADGSLKYCNNIRLKKIRNASHWVQQDEPDEVNLYMEEFLNDKSASK